MVDTISNSLKPTFNPHEPRRGGDLSLPVIVSINSEDAPVTSLSAVADKPGWFQVVTAIPADAPTDAPVTVILTVGGQSSQTG